MSTLPEHEPQPGAVQEYLQTVVSERGDLALRIATVVLLGVACLQLAGVKEALGAQSAPAASAEPYDVMARPPGADRDRMFEKMDQLTAKLGELKAAVCATGTRQDFATVRACSVAP